MLTLGQAACLVLDQEQTFENRKTAKEFFQESSLGVTFLYGNNPMEPFAIGKNIIKKNPFKYKQYPDTPPSSPRVPSEAEETELTDQDEGSCSGDSDSSAKVVCVNHGKRNIVALAKQLFSTENPVNDELFKRGFFTNSELYTELEKHFPDLSKIHSHAEVALWLNKESAHFGPIVTSRHKDESAPIRGRWLYLGSDTIREFLTESSAAFRKHAQTTEGEWLNIGYVRKSATKESDSARKKLLALMRTRLVNRCLCTKIFISPCSPASASLFKRDTTKPAILEDVPENDGDTQDLLAFLAVTAKKIRLCVIDYAGLSTDPDDIMRMLKLNNHVKEIVVDHGSRIEVLDRYSLLSKKSKAVTKFKCRTSCVKRSTQ